MGETGRVPASADMEIIKTNRLPIARTGGSGGLREASLIADGDDPDAFGGSEINILSGKVEVVIITIKDEPRI